jgi:hypothetical protein
MIIYLRMRSLKFQVFPGIHFFRFPIVLIRPLYLCVLIESDEAARKSWFCFHYTEFMQINCSVTTITQLIHFPGSQKPSHSIKLKLEFKDENFQLETNNPLSANLQ